MAIFRTKSRNNASSSASVCLDGSCGSASVQSSRSNSSSTRRRNCTVDPCSSSSSSSSSNCTTRTSRLRSLLTKIGGAGSSSQSQQGAASYRLSAVGLDIEGLERFLLYTLPRYTVDRTLARQAQTEFNGLAEKWRRAEQQQPSNISSNISSSSRSLSSSRAGASGHFYKQQLQRAAEQCYDELSNILILLYSFLAASASSTLPPVVVYEVHLYVGQIQEILALRRRRKSTSSSVTSCSSNNNNMNNNNTCSTNFNEAAMASYMKALWVASCSTDIPLDLLALVLHRLSKLSGRMGMIPQARNMLYRAVQFYSASGTLPKDHPTLLDAHDFLNRFHLQTLVLSEGSASGGCGSNLSQLHSSFSSFTSSSSSSTSLLSLASSSSLAFVAKSTKSMRFHAIPEHSS